MSLEKDIQATLKDPTDYVVLRRIFLLALRFHYSLPTHYYNYSTRFGDLLWTPDDKTRTLNVELSDIYDPNAPATKPGVYPSIGVIQYQRQSVDYDEDDGEDNSYQTFTAQASTELTVSHISTTPDLSAALAASTTAFLFGTRPWFMRNLQLLDFTITGTGPTELVKTAPDSHFRTLVKSGIVFNYRMSITQEGHRLKKFTPILRS